MGLGSSRSATPQVIYMDELRSWVDTELEQRYRRGMGGVLSALTPAFALLVALQESAIGMGGIVADKLAEQKEGKDSTLIASKGAIDSIVLCVDSIAKDFPVVLDYATLRIIIKTFREAIALIQPALTALANSHSALLQHGLAEASAHLATLRLAVEEVEAKAEASKTFTQQVGGVRARLLAKVPLLLEELAVLGPGLKAKRDYEEALERGEEARAAAEAAGAAPLLHEGRQLEAATGALVQQMNDRLAPFIRITHNIKGKQGKIEESGLTPSEIEIVHKYTAVLLQRDLYVRLAEEGGALEAFLEALFLLGIAGGIGAQPQEPAAKQSVLSRKSQAILANALSSFDADNFRSCFQAWQHQHRRLLALKAQAAFGEEERVQAGVLAGYEEAGRALERASKEWARAAPAFHKALLATQECAAHIQHGCREELGQSVALRLPLTLHSELK